MPLEVEIKYGDGLVVEFPDEVIPPEEREAILSGAMNPTDGSFGWFVQRTLDEKFSGIRNFMRQFAGFDENLTELDKAALSTMMVPIVGDITGLAADIDMYTNDPESRTVLNGLLTAAGLLPLVPAASSLKKGADALDMSQEARLQRARDMGFDTDTPVYHGTNTDFDEFDPDRAIGTLFWSTTNKAAIEAGEVGAQGKGVIKEMYHRIQNPAGWEEYDKFGIDELIAQGYDGLKLPDGDGHYTIVAFYPNQYRSVDAAFDPEKKDSANLLAEIAGGAVLTGAVANEKKKKKDEGA